MDSAQRIRLVVEKSLHIGGEPLDLLGEEAVTCVGIRGSLRVQCLLAMAYD